MTSAGSSQWSHVGKWNWWSGLNKTGRKSFIIYRLWNKNQETPRDGDFLIQAKSKLDNGENNNKSVKKKKNDQDIEDEKLLQMVQDKWKEYKTNVSYSSQSAVIW